MAIADELIALLGYRVTGEDQLNRYNRNLDKTAKGITAMGVAAGVAAGFITAKLIGGIKDGIGSLIDTNAQFETIATTLLTVEGSSEKANKSLAWIQQFAKTTPFDLAQVSEAFVKLKAYGIDPIAGDTLKTLGDAGSAMGKTLNQSVEMFSDAATFQFERMKEYGITSSQKGDQVTFSWVKNGQQMTKVVKKNGDDIRKFVIENLGSRFAGAMDRQSKTWVGMISNLGDTWTNFQKSIGEKGFFSDLEGKVQSILDMFNKLSDDGSLDKWANRISKGLTAVSNIVWAIGIRIGKNISTLVENFDKFKLPLEILGGLIARVIIRMFPFISFLVLAGLALDDFFSYLQGGDSYIGDFIKSIDKLMSGNLEGAGKLLGDLATGALALAGAGIAIGGFSMALSPLTAALLAFAAAFALAKAGLDYLDSLNKKVESIKAVPNPRDQPGFITTDPADHDAQGNMLYKNGAAIIDRPNPPDVSTQMDKGALDSKFGAPEVPQNNAPAWWENGMKNLEGNIAAQGSKAPPVLNDNKQDNRQFPQTNNITVNQTVTQPAAAPGAAAQATGAAVAGAVTQQRSQIATEPAF